MGTKASNGESDRVRENTSPEALKNIDRAMYEKVLYYATQPREVVTRRIAALDREWDVERLLEANASSLALLGLVFGVTKSRKYLLLSAGVMGFLLSHSIRGWCPPLPAFRALGVRTRSEIDREKYALKVIRGDFQDVATPSEALRENPVSDVMSAVKQP